MYQFQVSAIIRCCTLCIIEQQMILALLFWHPAVKGHRVILPPQALGENCAFFSRFNGCQKLWPFPAVDHLLHMTSSLFSSAITLFAVIVTSKRV